MWLPQSPFSFPFMIIMSIQQEPFRPYNTSKVRDSFTINFNAAERKAFEELKKLLNQKKDSTAMKQLAFIGAKALQSNLIKPIVNTIIDNRRKNSRLGIVDFEDEI